MHKWWKVALIVTVFLVALASNTAAQVYDPCSPEGIMLQLWNIVSGEDVMVSDIEAWVTEYNAGDCPADLKAGAQALADDYIALLESAASLSSVEDAPVAVEDAPAAETSLTLEMPGYDAEVMQVISMLNEWRIQEGLWPFKLNDTLMKMAADQAAYLNSLPDIPDDIHKDASGAYPQQRALNYDWPFYDNAGQMAIDEIAYVGASSGKALEFWKGSSIHSKASTNPGYREIGVATLPHPYGHLYIVVLGGRPDELPALFDPNSDQIYLSSERFKWAAGDRIQDVTQVQLFEEGGDPTGTWMPWTAAIAAPEPFTVPYSVLYSDGAHEITTTVSPATDIAWLPDTLAGEQQTVGESACGLVAGAMGFANVRETPSITAEQVGAINAPAQYVVDSKTPAGDWMHIELGWVASHVVEMFGACESVSAGGEAAASDQPTSDCQLSAGDAGFANIRQSPSPGATQVDTIRGGDRYNVLGQSADGQWFEIELGWVAKSVVWPIGSCDNVATTN